MRFFTFTCSLLLVFQLSFGQQTEEGAASVPIAEAVRMPVNSNFPEYAPVLSWDGKILYFAKDNAPGNLGFSNNTDIWYTRRASNFSWSPPINIGRPLNDDGHNIPMTLSPLQNQLFLARKRPDQHFDYLASAAEGRMWQAPRSLNIDWFKDGTFPTSQIKSFFISYDQRYFLFLAETPNGCGQLDIYVSIKKENGQWAYPFNIGPLVNSDENECSIFLAADNQSLYFASNGHGGMGGYDIFVSRRLDESWLQWSEPLNLGAAVNSAADERYPAMSLIGDELYFSRKKQEGDQDIYFCPLTPSLRPFTRHIIHGKFQQKSVDEQISLQVQTIKGESRRVLQSGKGGYLTVLPPDQAYLLFQPSPVGTFSESLAFFGKKFFDTNHAKDWNTLLQNDDYQERETHIEQLKNTRAQLLLKLNQQESEFQQYFQRLNQYVVESLKDLRWTQEEEQRLSVLRSKYKQLSQGGVVRDTSNSNQVKKDTSSYQVVDKNDHFKKQKKRLRQQLGSAKKKKPKSPESGEFTSKGMQLIPFDQLLNNLYGRWLSEIALSNWKKLEEQLTPTRIQNLSNQLGEEETSRLSKYGLPANPAMDVTQKMSMFSSDPSALPYPWQRDVKEELGTLLYTSFVDQLPQLLQPHIEKILDEKILLSAQQHKAFLLHQEIQASVNMQIAIEKRLPSSAESPPSISQENENSLSGSLIQQYDFEVFSLHPGRHIPFPGIVFEPNTSRISPLAEPEINRLIRFLKEHPDMVVEIGLYSYGELSHTLALDLCAQRAEVLINFIASKGISKDRLVKGEYGKKEIVDYKYSWRNNIVIVKTME